MKAILLCFLTWTVATAAASNSPYYCDFVPGSGVGADEFLLAAEFGPDNLEQDCAKAVLDAHPTANGARIHGRAGAAQRLCSAVFSMEKIVAHAEQRSCYLYPSSHQKTVCTTAPMACTGTHTDALLELPDAVITGHLPTELGRLSATLESLDLSGNMLSGTLPSELGRLTKLRQLRVSQNHRISGSVPSQLGALTNLRVLSMFGNALGGALPSELGRLNPAHCYLVRAQWPDEGGAEEEEQNAFACPLPKLSTGCGMNGFAFPGRDAHHDGVCPSAANSGGDISYHRGFSAGDPSAYR